MIYSRAKLALTIATALAVATFAFTTLSVTDRVRLLESRSGVERPGWATIQSPVQADTLREEISALRSLLEEQTYRIEGLKKSHRDRYVDLDSRLSHLEKNLLAAVDEEPTSLPSFATQATTVPGSSNVVSDPEVPASPFETQSGEDVAGEFTFRAASEPHAGTGPVRHL